MCQEQAAAYLPDPLNNCAIFVIITEQHPRQRRRIVVSPQKDTYPCDQDVTRDARTSHFN